MCVRLVSGSAREGGAALQDATVDCWPGELHFGNLQINAENNWKPGQLLPISLSRARETGVGGGRQRWV